MDALEFRQLTPSFGPAFGAFLDTLRTAGDDFFFHPHELSKAYAELACRNSTKDLYYLAIIGAEVVGYGMLRGWDEGWAVPSLGLAIHPAWRGRQLAYALMQFLHVAARARGASRIRLKVNSSNTRAIRLYTRCGYVFEPFDADNLVGFLTL